MKITFALILFFIGIAIFPQFLLSFEGAGCGQDCASCHSLTSDEAGKLLKIDVFKVSSAPVKGLWQVEGARDGKKVRAFIDYAKKYVVLINGFIPLSEIGKPQELRKIDLNLIPLTDALIMGNPSAKNRVIVFTDPDCPYCKKEHEEIKELLKKNKDIVFYIKLFPLINVHPKSYEKSKSILCSNSLKLLDDAINGKNLPRADCDTKVLDENIKLAEQLAINSTPTLILPDGRLISGFIDGSTLVRLMEIRQ